MGNEAPPAAIGPSSAVKPSIDRRLALAAIVGVFALGGEGCVRNAFAGHMFDISNLLVALLFFVAPFFGAMIGSAVIEAGGFFRPGFVGLTGLIGLIAGMWLGGEIDPSYPKLMDYVPHLSGAFLGALVGTSWTRAQPRRTPLMNVLLLVALFLVAFLLLPVLLRA